MTDHFADHVLVISHPRSGTHLTIDTLLSNFPKWNRGYFNLDRIKPDNEAPVSVEEASRLLQEAPRVIKTHMHSDVKSFFLGDPTMVQFVNRILECAKKVYVYRDGRDVLVSLYYYVQRFNVDLTDVSITDFIRMPNDQDKATLGKPMTRPGYWAFHVEGWLDRPDVLPISFKLLREDNDRAIEKLAEYLGEPAPKHTRSPIRRTSRFHPQNRWINRFRKAFKRIQGIHSTSVAFRSGVRDDYASHFTQDDLAFIYDKAGDTLRSLHYLS